MNGTMTLKIFLSISLGLHLLFFSVSALLFPDFRFNGLRNLNIEVSFLPLISETKAPPQSVKQEARNTRHEERVLLRKEKKEESVFKKEQEPKSLLVQTEFEVVPVSNPSALVLENEKWEVGGMKEEEGIVESYGNPLTTTSSSGPSKVAMKNPSLSDGEVLFVQPRYAENQKPIYPQEARKKGYEGEVILRVEVLRNGRVGQIDVKKSSGYELLDRSALATVKQWRFVPAQKGEKAIPLWVNIPVKFQLQ
jgi:TonB family protein